MSTITHARSSGQPGRYLLSARDQHLVADATTSRGGPGQAWVAGELLLAALSTCAQAVIESHARACGLPVTDITVRGELEADGDKPGHYAFVRLDFYIAGVEQDAAQALVGEYQRVCPIYGSISRGAPVSVAVHVTPEP